MGTGVWKRNLCLRFMSLTSLDVIHIYEDEHPSRNVTSVTPLPYILSGHTTDPFWRWQQNEHELNTMSIVSARDGDYWQYTIDNVIIIRVVGRHADRVGWGTILLCSFRPTNEIHEQQEQDVNAIKWHGSGWVTYIVSWVGLNDLGNEVEWNSIVKYTR